MEINLVLVSILMIFSQHVAGKRFYGFGTRKGDHCTFKGYAPGGNKVTVQRIIAPTAKIEKGILSGLAGNMAKASSGTQHATMLLKGFGKLANIAPKLGPALGLFGVGFSMVKSFTDPSPQDILDEVNKAVGKLTEEMNNRLDEMKAYVGKKVIDLEKDLISREYKALFRFWSNCLKEVTKEEADECQEDAAKKIMGARPKFALFSDVVQADKMPSTDDVKRIEASLGTFRDYVLLNLLCLSTLTATYKEDTSKKDYYERYAKELNADIKWSVTYVKNAVSIIQRMHTGGDNCKDTMKCTKLKQYKEGWLVPVRTGDHLTCTCVFDRGDVSTQTCGFYVYIRYDGKRPGGRYQWFNAPTSNTEAGAKYVAQFNLDFKRTPYINALKNVITNYWDNEILDLVPEWESLKVEGIASDQMVTDEDIQRRRNTMVLSDNFERRKKQVDDEMDVELDMLYGNRGYDDGVYYEDMHERGY